VQYSIFESQATGSLLANTLNVFDPLNAAAGPLKSAMIMQQAAPMVVRKTLYQIEINDYRSEESGQIRYNQVVNKEERKRLHQTLEDKFGFQEGWSYIQEDQNNDQLAHYSNLKDLLTQPQPPGDAFKVNFYLIRGLISAKNDGLTLTVPE
jgi:hypothetical protein